MTACYQLLASTIPDLSGVASDLTRRLESTRWSASSASESGAEACTHAYAQAWAEWLRQEPGNPWGEHRLVATDAGQVRFVRFPGRGRTPLLLLHGWPTSFLAFHRVVEPLRHEASDVVLAILPGFGSPLPPAGDMSVASISAALAEAMIALGHERFIVHGQDWGSVIARSMASRFPRQVAGVHVSAGLGGFMADGPGSGLAWQRLHQFAAVGAGYLTLQAHRGQFLAVGLQDSPAGLLAWQLDKYDLWQGPLGADFGLGDDFILANATFYWASGCIGSSIRIYADNRGAPHPPDTTVPTGVSVFGRADFASHDVAARENNLVAWYEHATGGHVAALDADAGFVADLSDFIHLVGDSA